jgi:hypothetical protein
MMSQERPAVLRTPPAGSYRQAEPPIVDDMHLSQSGCRLQIPDLPAEHWPGAANPPQPIAEPAADRASEENTGTPEHATNTRWEAAAEAVDRIRHFAEAHGLDRIHQAALRLCGPVNASSAEAQNHQSRPATLVRTLTAARELAREIDTAASVRALTQHQHEHLMQDLDRLAHCLGTDFELIAAPVREPKWLDVASPAHGQVNVAGARTFFHPGHVAATDAAAVVVADDCTLDAVDHYHLRRVSLDCGSLLRDRDAVESFAVMLTDPSDENIRVFRQQLRRIVSPVPEPGRQVYRERVATTVTTHLDGPDVAILGDESQVRSKTLYHVRETVVPLADLLHQREDLIRALAARPDDANRETPIMAALAEIEDAALLRYAWDTGETPTTVRRWWKTRQVDLAAAIMVGAGNTLTRSSEIEAGRPRAGNLARFDRLVRQHLQEIRRTTGPYAEEAA